MSFKVINNNNNNNNIYPITCFSYITLETEHFIFSLMYYDLEDSELFIIYKTSKSHCKNSLIIPKNKFNRYLGKTHTVHVQLDTRTYQILVKDHYKNETVKWNFIEEFGDNKHDKENKPCVFETIIYSKINYIVFLKNNRTISDEIYIKVIRKKLTLVIASPFELFPLSLTVPIVEFFERYCIVYGLYELSKAITCQEFLGEFHKSLISDTLNLFFQRSS
ncbi:fam-l protein [Plasmodium brasilianum]|uniref:Fam-l protein n=1 Tax=Plasmodium brasilianum TaxID=5824 RepID=A0ACB9Y258_PLABR|nr:fam-l protein [Plasmodium brasilianum]